MGFDLGRKLFNLILCYLPKTLGAGHDHRKSNQILVFAFLAIKYKEELENGGGPNPILVYVVYVYVPLLRII